MVVLRHFWALLEFSGGTHSSRSDQDILFFSLHLVWVRLILSIFMLEIFQEITRYCLLDGLLRFWITPFIRSDSTALSLHFSLWSPSVIRSQHHWSWSNIQIYIWLARISASANHSSLVNVWDTWRTHPCGSCCYYYTSRSPGTGDHFAIFFYLFFITHKVLISQLFSFMFFSNLLSSPPSNSIHVAQITIISWVRVHSFGFSHLIWHLISEHRKQPFHRSFHSRTLLPFFWSSLGPTNMSSDRSNGITVIVDGTNSSKIV